MSLTDKGEKNHVKNHIKNHVKNVRQKKKNDAFAVAAAGHLLSKPKQETMDPGEAVLRAQLCF
jgi:hypothetical protein